jgi:hypothetical protein
MLRSDWVKLLIILCVIAVTFLGTAAAQKSSAPRPQDRLAIGEESIRQLLPLMDTDKNGNVSKQSYMKFMEAEFHRLDKSNRGEINTRLLTQSNLSASRFTGK